MDHENIIKLVDANVAEDGRDESSYLVMPIAAHGDLDHRQEIYTGNLDSILQVALQIASALQCAHGSGVIHRDIKPGNILFPDVGHRVWVADFGISFDRSGERHSQEGEVVGPRFFIAPELDEGRSGDFRPAADIYSIGMVIFYMLTGGKRVARENVFAEEHTVHFAKGHRYGLLRLLLSRMISPFDRRYREMEPVIRELRQIEQWERNAVSVLLDEQAAAATQQLQRRVASEIERLANFETVRNDEIRLLHSVADSVADWLGGVLRVQRDVIGAGAVLVVSVFKGRPGISQPIKVDTGNNTLLEEQTRVTLAIALPHAGRRTIYSLVLAVCSELNFNLGYDSDAYFGTAGNPMMAVLPFYCEASEHQPHLIPFPYQSDLAM
jgi:plasmid stabilization system protein ParE